MSRIENKEGKGPVVELISNCYRKHFAFFRADCAIQCYWMKLRK